MNVTAWKPALHGGPPWVRVGGPAMCHGAIPNLRDVYRSLHQGGEGSVKYSCAVPTGAALT
jgi:hypothetical protein